MNLVAKEFVAVKPIKPECWSLSRKCAGDSKRIAGCSLVNPNDRQGCHLMPIYIRKYENCRAKGFSMTWECRKVLKIRFVFHGWRVLLWIVTRHVRTPSQESFLKGCRTLRYERIRSAFKQQKIKCYSWMTMDPYGFCYKSQDFAVPMRSWKVLSKDLSPNSTVVQCDSGRDKGYLGTWFKDQKVEFMREHWRAGWKRKKWERGGLGNYYRRNRKTDLEEKDHLKSWNISGASERRAHLSRKKHHLLDIGIIESRKAAWVI